LAKACTIGIPDFYACQVDYLAPDVVKSQGVVRSGGNQHDGACAGLYAGNTKNLVGSQRVYRIIVVEQVLADARYPGTGTCIFNLSIKK
jgi:hypothetical protein